MKFWWVLTAIGAVIGQLILLFGMGSAKSAPQEAAVAALAIGAAVIPYVFARAIQLFGQTECDQRRHEEILNALRGPREAAALPSAADRAVAAVTPSGVGSSSPRPQHPPA